MNAQEAAKNTEDNYYKVKKQEEEAFRLILDKIHEASQKGLNSIELETWNQSHIDNLIQKGYTLKPTYYSMYTFKPCTYEVTWGKNVKFSLFTSLHKLKLKYFR